MVLDRASEGFEEAVWSREATGVPEKIGYEEGGMEAAFRLNVENGGTVVATFPFLGNTDEGQLSFQIGDSIVILEKDTQWSWGKLVRTGEEGWTPNNYVQSTFKPLPGIHELQMKMRIKKAREEAIDKGENPDEAEARVKREIMEGNQDTSEKDAVAQQEGNLSLQYGEAGVGQGQYFAGVQDPNQPSMWPGGMEAYGGYNQIEGYNMYNNHGGGAYDPNAAALGGGGGYGGGLNDPFAAGGYGADGGGGAKGGFDWSNEGEVDMAFGMWMENLDENKGDGGGTKDDRQQDSQQLRSDVDLDEMHLRREEAARKLLETEKRYVKLLDALVETIVKPSMGEGSRQIISPLSHQEAQETFGVLQAGEILSVNEALKKQLTARMKNYNDDTCFGDLFVRFAPFLKAYVDYCTQHDSSASRVGLLAGKNERFQHLLNKSSMDPRSMGLDVQSLLSLPLERIPQYKDLLEDLQDNTDESHPDYKLLDKAIEEIADVANFIDESIKQRENQAKLLGVQAMLSDPNDLSDVDHGKKRIYVKSGVILKLGRRSDRTDYFTLFNSGLMHARKALVGNKFVFRRLTEILRVEDVGYIKSKPKATHVFRIVTNGHIYLLDASSSEEKNSWMRALQVVIHSNNRKQLHQGSLLVIKLDRDPPEIKKEFFYVFTDVVVGGKSLWRGKFKYKQTIYVERVEEDFMYNPHRDPPLPAELSSGIPLSGALTNCFRIVDCNGKSTLLMAPSVDEKAVWLKALKKQLEYRNTNWSKEDTSSRSCSVEDDALDSDDSRDTPKAKENSTNTAPTIQGGSKKGTPSPKLSKMRKSSSTSQEPVETDLLDLLSGEPIPSHSSSARPTNDGSRRATGGGRARRASSLPQKDLPSQKNTASIPATPTDRLLTNDLAAVLATSSGQPSGGGGGYAHHHQGGVPNYAQQQQQYLPTAPDSSSYVQQQPLNAFPPQPPLAQGYMGGGSAYQGGVVGMQQQPHYYQNQQPIVQPNVGGASQPPISMGHGVFQQQTPPQPDVRNVHGDFQYQ